VLLPLFGAVAVQIVMSRTFGNASPTGGVGVRMCVPLIDMLNHAGDTAVDGLLSSGEIIAQDNVRWDVVSPENSSSGSWEMVLSSTKPISEGEPLLLSYREGLNEEFVLCYGFVPPSNPHDTVQLLGGLSEALEHLWQQDLAKVGVGACCAVLVEILWKGLCGGTAGCTYSQHVLCCWQLAARVNNNKAGRRGVEDPCARATDLRQSDALLVSAPDFETAGVSSMAAAAPSQHLLLQGASPGSLREVYRAAHDAGLQALQEEVAAAAAGISDSSSWGQLLETLEPIQVSVCAGSSRTEVQGLECQLSGSRGCSEPVF
jgi:hypothetical protein